MDGAAIRAAAIEKRNRRIAIGREGAVPKLSYYLKLKRALAESQGKMTKASETEAVGATMPSDEAAEEAACEEAQRRKLALQAQLMKVIRTRREAERLQQRRRFCRHR